MKATPKHNKPLFEYAIRLGPTLMPAEGGYQVVEEPSIQTARGNMIRYLPCQDLIVFQVLNNDGDVLFSAPAHAVLWVKANPAVKDACPVVPLKLV